MEGTFKLTKNCNLSQKAKYLARRIHSAVKNHLAYSRLYLPNKDLVILLKFMRLFACVYDLHKKDSVNTRPGSSLLEPGSKHNYKTS